MRGSDIDSSSAARRAFVAHFSALALSLGLAGHSVAAGPAPRRTLLVLGDSLSAEYGLPRGAGWVALLAARLARERPNVQVVNASISGDTTSGGRSRLSALLARHKPAVVVIELGGNDALRGLPLAMTRENLSAMARAAKDAGARVLLVGVAVPPNYGRKYGEDFFKLFDEVAHDEGLGRAPFLLAGVADAPDAQALFQDDRIHPKAQAHPRMLANVWPALAPLLR
jgi:acyl-CoA thioesterase-1